MTKEEKRVLVQELTQTLAQTPNVYLTEAGGLSVAEVNELRGLAYKAGIKMQVVKNTLLRKAMDASAGNYEGVYPLLKNQTSVFFTAEDVNGPAKVIEKFRGKKKTKPVLKGAYIDEAVFVGDESLKALVSLKSKNELIAEIVSLLQGPVMSLVGQLNSGGNTISGLLKALEERGEKN